MRLHHATQCLYVIREVICVSFPLFAEYATLLNCFFDPGPPISYLLSDARHTRASRCLADICFEKQRCRTSISADSDLEGDADGTAGNI